VQKGLLEAVFSFYPLINPLIFKNVLRETNVETNILNSLVFLLDSLVNLKAFSSSTLEMLSTKLDLI
jgi:hypothetical protein